MIDRKAMGARIKALRKARRWPQKQLANLVGIRYELLNKYEGGFGLPPAMTLLRLARAFDTSTDYLLTGNEIEQSHFASARVFRRYQAVEQMTEDDQQVIIRLIDAFTAKQRVTAAMASPD